MSSNVGVLAHNQPLTGKANTHVDRDVAYELLRRMVAEPITHKLIRMFPPESVFPAIRMFSGRKIYVPEKLPPREVPGCWFQLPQSDTWKREHRTVTFLEKVTACV